MPHRYSILLRRALKRVSVRKLLIWLYKTSNFNHNAGPVIDSQSNTAYSRFVMIYYDMNIKCNNAIGSRFAETSTSSPLRLSALVPPGQLDQAYEQLKEATYLFGRVCDDLNPEASMCLSTLARVAYLQGKHTEVCHCRSHHLGASLRLYDRNTISA